MEEQIASHMAGITLQDLVDQVRESSRFEVRGERQ
jgi:hypothetical protein